MCAPPCIYIYVYIEIYMCVCVCICFCIDFCMMMLSEAAVSTYGQLLVYVRSAEITEEANTHDKWKLRHIDYIV